MDLSALKGYTLVRTEKLDDIEGTGYLLKHEKTGARIAVLSNDDENKVFSIGFRTLPENSTGVAHILEHSVLCGSDKFPVKDPFTEIQKGSLNTFLNAMTYPDKTIYPVASTNDTDFRNLMDVYLDAVLHPRIYSTPEIFYQEGWHYEYDEATDKLDFSGVVYNEMRGAFSSPDSVVDREILHQMYPDTSYGNESGGDPENIPDLSYEEFCAFHGKYYHPSNSFIILYGNMDIASTLNWMDEEYLGTFEANPIDFSWKAQPSYNGIKECTIQYPATKDRDAQTGTIISYTIEISPRNNPVDWAAIDLLSGVLFEVPGAPLKEALVKAGIGADYIMACTMDLYQPFVQFQIKDAKQGQSEEFLRIFNEEIGKYVKEGVSRDALRSLFAVKEFSYKEANFGSTPKGIVYLDAVYSNWIYDENDPFSGLNRNAVFEELKRVFDTDYFERVLEKYFLNPAHAVLLEAVPDPLMAENDEKRKTEKLEQIRKNLSPEELDEIKEKIAKLNEFHETPDTKEALDTIPHLNISDIRREVKHFDVSEKFDGGLAHVHANLKSNQIIYLKLMFDLSEFKKEDFFYIALLDSLIVKVDTKNYGYRQLNEKLMLVCGGFNIGPYGYKKEPYRKEYFPSIAVTAKFLVDKCDGTMEMIDEVLTNTLFEDDERIRNVLEEQASALDFDIQNNMFSVALGQMGGMLSGLKMMDEVTEGLSYVNNLHELLDNFDDRKEHLKAELGRIYEKLFKNNRVFVSIIAGEKEHEVFVNRFVPALTGFFAKMNDTVVESKDRFFVSEGLEKLRKEFEPSGIKKRGIVTSGKVQYVIKGGVAFEEGEYPDPVYLVLRTMMGLTYLYDEIRVKGGAYGAFLMIRQDCGAVLLGSYRDPNLERTLEVYEGLPKYLENFDGSREEMEQYIISTVANFDSPMSVTSEGRAWITYFYEGGTQERRQKNRNRLLDLTAEDIRKTAAGIRKILAADGMCVAGTREKIEGAKELFEEIIEI